MWRYEGGGDGGGVALHRGMRGCEEFKIAGETWGRGIEDIGG